MTALEDRIQRWEENTAIQELKFEYGRLIDAGLAGREAWPQPAFLDQFTDGAVWEANVHGRFEGKDAIRDFFTSVSEPDTFSLHFMMNPTIVCDPPFDDASGRWLSIETLTIDGEAVWLTTDYNDVYTKQSGRWQFRHTRAEIFFMTPYDTGWVKEQFMGGASG